ncbi:MAG: AEC family transporter [Candidatus Goldbacteria bacterium]|nr:AEC family transporter [Candidatus Goldiibacteriota bacterium]
MIKSFIIIFLTVISGYIFSYFYGNKKETFENSLSDYLYYFALPLTIFLKVINFEMKNMDFYIFIINSLPIIFLYLLIYSAYRFGIINASFARTSMISSTLGNVVYLGFGVIQYNFGEHIIPYAAVSVGIQNLIIFSIGVFFINLICFEKSCIIIGTKKAFLNPIFLSTFIGFFFSLLDISISDFLNDFLVQVSKTTVPLALFLIGVSIYGKKFNISYLKKVILISSLKLVILPFISFIFIFLFAKFDIVSLVSFILYTMPVAIAAFVVARDFELEKDVVAGSVIFTTVLYFIFYWIYIFLVNNFFYI